MSRIAATDRGVRFTCTDKGQHQKVYPRVVFEPTKTRFMCGRCNRDVQLSEDRFADVLAALRAAGISEVDVSALPGT